MIIALPAVNRTLPENVHHWFEEAPCYILYDSHSNRIDHIRNYLRYRRNRGIAAAQMLFLKGVDVIVAGRMQSACSSFVSSLGITLYLGFSGTCGSAVDKVMKDEAAGRLKKPSRVGSGLSFFTFIEVDHIFEGANIQYEDWDFIRPLGVSANIPSDWSRPIDYSDGSYLLELSVINVVNPVHPVELEFGMFNLPESDDPERLERVSYGQYCGFTSDGSFLHSAFLKDMEVTTCNSSHREWDWSNGFRAPFVLIKPYGQNPYPLKVKLRVSVIESEKRANPSNPEQAGI